MESGEDPATKSEEGGAEWGASVMHAMTPDGQTVPITFNPATGQYHTANGEPVVIQMAQEQQQAQQQEDEVAVSQLQMEEDPAMDDLSSLAAAAETHGGMQNVRVVQSDGTVINVGEEEVVASEGAQIQPQQIRIVKMDNVQEEQQQQQPQQHQHQQIRVLNSDGTVSNLPSNVRVITSNQLSQQQQQFRVVRAGATAAGGAPSAKTLTVDQAEQMGLISSTTAAALSPAKVKHVRLGGAQQPQQVIRIPTSNLQAGSIQQIQIGDKIQYVRVIGSSASAAAPILPSTAKVTGVKIAIPPATKPSTAPATVTASKAQRTILPSEQSQSSTSAEPSKIKQEEISADLSESASAAAETVAPGTFQQAFEPTGVRPRKPCNCTKSQCLKLYCDCFANGEFCNNCNCNNCSNNLKHESVRAKAIKQCLDRNPNAFKPKIGRIANDGERRHNKGCNCKRSGCLKNYCECYEAKIPCTDACKCIGCKNVEDESGGGDPARKKLSVATPTPSVASKLVGGHAPSGDISHSSLRSAASLKAKLVPPVPKDQVDPKQPYNFITSEVVEATCQCLLAQAEEAERNKVKEENIEGLILEEFGRCLLQIIEIANRSKSQNAASV